MFRKFAFILSAAVLLPTAGQAQPTPPASCAASSNGVFQAALFDWGAGIDYLDCYGPTVGNDNGNQAAAINAKWGSYGTFTLMGSSGDAGNGPFTSTDGSPLVFDSPISGYFALTLKQANSFSVYLLHAAAPVSSINWDTRGVVGNGGTLDPSKLSHAVLYAGPMSTVPEPSSYLLMGSGLAGLLGVARWRRRA